MRSLGITKFLIPVIIALRTKFAKNVRPEHLKYQLDHKEMIQLVNEAVVVPVLGSCSKNLVNCRHPMLGLSYSDRRVLLIFSVGETDFGVNTSLGNRSKMGKIRYIKWVYHE